MSQTCQHLTVSYLCSQICGVGHHTTDLSPPDCVLPVQSELWGWLPHHRPVTTWLCLTCTVRAVGLITTPQTCHHLTVSYLYSQSCGVDYHTTDLSPPDCVLPVQSELWGWLPHHRPVTTWLCLTCTVRAMGLITTPQTCHHLTVSYLYSQSCGVDCHTTCSHSQIQSHKDSILFFFFFLFLDSLLIRLHSQTESLSLVSIHAAEPS